MLQPITISPNIQSGEPVFTNTRVPVKNLFDYLKAGLAQIFFPNFFGKPINKKMEFKKSLPHHLHPLPINTCAY